ncbi:MAG: winged helix-turn-helix domain-containing protein [Oscillospiraceae bacterium]|nr:winged helix-turn-helix domain-containing protein [Oscillospiraceae bacterium]
MCFTNFCSTRRTDRDQRDCESISKCRRSSRQQRQIYCVLHRHGWRKVMPRSKHPKKASEDEIAASKKLTLPSRG